MEEKKKTPTQIIRDHYRNPSALKYNSNYLRNLIAYTEDCREKGEYPTIAGYCSLVYISQETVRVWRKTYPEFGAAVNTMLQYAENLLVSRSLAGKYNAQFAQFVAKNYHNMDDKQTTALEGNVGLTVKFVEDTDDAEG